MKYRKMPLELMPLVIPCAPKLKIGSAVKDKTLKNKGRPRKMMTSFTRLLSFYQNKGIFASRDIFNAGKSITFSRRSHWQVKIC